MSDDALLDTAIESARAMGTRRLTRTSLLRLADAYMARLAEDEQREDDGLVTEEWLDENLTKLRDGAWQSSKGVAVHQWRPDNGPQFFGVCVGSAILSRNSVRQLRRLIAVLEG